MVPFSILMTGPKIDTDTVHLDDLKARNETVNLHKFFEDVDNVKANTRVVEQVLQRVKVIKEKVEALEKSNASRQKLPGCCPEPSAYIEPGPEYKETIERGYFTVTGQEVDDEMMEKLIESGGSETLLQQAIQ
ncbi:hypothetical protein F3Y22_tig00110388pilonHSYRG00325 [Hibiscus syriacus]|uniref:Syntaxin N-terminal domain-containing protein n=1 Tax=Hibiscus syriacus TaxID=106335 RepID=A0A6A3AVA9_HIBSY|nr:hypothetical protein F3Y22_tig00110388pilonHSYRG00325 [Hibiscus syriacus]